MEHIVLFLFLCLYYFCYAVEYNLGYMMLWFNLNIVNTTKLTVPWPQIAVTWKGSNVSVLFLIIIIFYGHMKLL
jgi:hypothetical protein